MIRFEYDVAPKPKNPSRVVTKKPAKKRVATKPVTTDSARVKAWRAKNRERYNATMKTYRAKRRAAAKEKK